MVKSKNIGSCKRGYAVGGASINWFPFPSICGGMKHYPQVGNGGLHSL